MAWAFVDSSVGYAKHLEEEKADCTALFYINHSFIGATEVPEKPYIE